MRGKRTDCHSPKAPVLKTTKTTKAKLVKYQPNPILATSGGVITAVIAAAGFLIMFSNAIAPAEACGAHSVKNANVTTRTDDIPSPTTHGSSHQQRTDAHSSPEPHT